MIIRQKTEFKLQHKLHPIFRCSPIYFTERIPYMFQILTQMLDPYRYNAPADRGRYGADPDAQCIRGGGAVDVAVDTDPIEDQLCVAVELLHSRGAIVSLVQDLPRRAPMYIVSGIVFSTM